jgi:imidazoleglycerol-phosphate dehydratase
MDEALILCAADFSGRSYLSYKIRLNQAKIGEFDTELVKEFFLGFVRAASLTLHIKQLEGGNTHHVIEGVFKAFARALRQATEADAAFFDEVPSTKGVL